MKVFISWSGVPSRELAEALRWWLPKVIQGTIPFVSAKDIDKGSNWINVLAEELKDSEFGIVCLTAENLTSPWLNYEAGAITKSVDSRVCPLLLDVDKSSVEGPLKQLQLTSLEYEEVLDMLRSLNSAGGGRLIESDLEEAAKMWWPKLAEKVELIKRPDADRSIVGATEPTKPASSETEMLEDILNHVRRLDKKLSGFERSQPVTLTAPTRDWVPEFIMLLGNEGLEINSASIKSDGIELRASKVGSPLPGESYAMLQKTARERGQQISIRGRDGRYVVFSEAGHSDEPPF